MTLTMSTMTFDELYETVLGVSAGGIILCAMWIVAILLKIESNKAVLYSDTDDKSHSLALDVAIDEHGGGGSPPHSPSMASSGVMEVEKPNTDTAPSLKKKRRRKLTLGFKLMQVASVSVLILLTYVILVMSKASMWVSALASICVFCVFLRFQIGDELRRQRLDRLVLMISLFLLIASLMSACTYAMKSLSQGEIYEGPARIVGYDMSTYNNTEHDPSTRTDLMVQWGKNWGCPMSGGKLCQAHVHGAMCTVNQGDANGNNDNDKNNNDRRRKVLVQQRNRLLEDGKVDDDLVVTEAPKQQKETSAPEDATSAPEESTTEGQDGDTTTTVQEEQDEVDQVESELTEEEKQNQDLEQENEDLTKENEELQAEVEELELENEKTEEESQVEVEEVKEEEQEDKDTYDEDIDYADEEVLDVEEVYYDAYVNEEEEVVEVEEEHETDDTKQEEDEQEISELETEKEDVTEELNTYEDEYDEQAQKDAEAVQEDKDAEEAFKDEEDEISQEYDEEEADVEEEEWTWDEPTTDYDDDLYDSEYWDYDWESVWGEYACEDLFDADMSDASYDASTPAGSDDYPFINIYGSCKTCEAYILDYFAQEAFESVDEYKQQAILYLTGATAGFIVTIIAFLKYKVSPTAENEMELLGSDGGVLA